MEGRAERLRGSERRRRVSNDQNLWSVKVSPSNLETPSLPVSILSAYSQILLIHICEMTRKTKVSAINLSPRRGLQSGFTVLWSLGSHLRHSLAILDNTFIWDYLKQTNSGAVDWARSDTNTSQLSSRSLCTVCIVQESNQRTSFDIWNSIQAPGSPFLPQQPSLHTIKCVQAVKSGELLHLKMSRSSNCLCAEQEELMRNRGWEISNQPPDRGR